MSLASYQAAPLRVMCLTIFDTNLVFQVRGLVLNLGVLLKVADPSRDSFLTGLTDSPRCPAFTLGSMRNNLIMAGSQRKLENQSDGKSRSMKRHLVV